jgi:hypothetical protein
MGYEQRVAAEGILRWVQASGQGTGWTTASAPVSGIWGFVKEFSWDSARSIGAAVERGTPVGWKEYDKKPISVTLGFEWTGTMPTPSTAAGATVPMIHLEHRANEGEMGAGTGRYYQFHGAIIESVGFKEGNPNMINVKLQALAMSGANASGYLG